MYFFQFKRSQLKHEDQVMKFGYTIVYVANVAASLEFYEKAFLFMRSVLHESGTYGELETGQTTLAFAAHQIAQGNLAKGCIAADGSVQPLGMEIGFITTEVEKVHANALQHGAAERAPPKWKPWGQLVSYLRAPDGTLVELCTPMVPAQ